MDILSIEVVTSIISIGAISMSIGSIMSFSKDMSGLHPKLTRVSHRLDRFCDGIKDSHSTVAELSELIHPLKEQESHLQSYYDEIKKISLELERKQLASEKIENGEKDIIILQNTVESI